MEQVHVVYYSRYYNIDNFIDNYVNTDKVVVHAVDHKGGAPSYPEGTPFVFISPSYEPEYVEPAFIFMENHHEYCKGIVGSGDRNYGAIYLYSVFELADTYSKEVYMGIENMGMPQEGVMLENLLHYLQTGELLGDIRTKGIETEKENYFNYKKAGNVEWHNPLTQK